MAKSPHNALLTPEQIATRTRGEFVTLLADVGFSARRIADALTLADNNGFDWSAQQYPAWPQTPKGGEDDA